MKTRCYQGRGRRMIIGTQRIKATNKTLSDFYNTEDKDIKLRLFKKLKKLLMH